MENNKIDFTGDGAFDRAFKTTCKKHNHKHLYFKECPVCATEEKDAACVTLYNNMTEFAFNMAGLTVDKEILAEVTKMVKAVKNHINLIQIK